MSNYNEAFLSQGNRAMRAGRYAEAIAHYVQVLIESPILGKSISANLSIAKQKYRNSRQGVEKPRIGVCGWELAHNPAGRVFTLTKLYETFADVEIIGCIFPRFGNEVWEPIRTTHIPKHFFVVEDELRFLDQAIALVVAHPYDIIHLSKPRAPNIFFGILYKLIWDAMVLMDVDDEELAFVGEETSISIGDYLKQHGQLPNIRDLVGKGWTRVAVGLAKEFDGVTVCNHALQQRYGGDIVRHARDEKLYIPSQELKRQSREKFGIPQDAKVVLFFGTPREHKGLIEVADAIASLRRKDIVFAIVGDFPDAKLKERLQAIRGAKCCFIGNQSFTVIPEVVAIGDLCLLLQDPDSTTAQFQTPAKLSDALAMDIPVLATQTAALADAFIAGALMPVTKKDLARSLAQMLDDTSAADRLRATGRRYFKENLSFAANVRRLKQAVYRHNRHPLSGPSTILAQFLLNDGFDVLLRPSLRSESLFSATSSESPSAVVQKVAVVAHVYYPELWPEFAKRLKKIRYPFDLFVTTTNDKAARVSSDVKTDFPSVRIEVLPNWGMDIWPLLALAPALVKDGYLAVCKLHTRRGEGEQGRLWRGLMLDALVGDDDTFTQIVLAFAGYPDLQQVGPATLYQSARKLMLDNESTLSDLFQQIEGRSLPTADWGYFSGAMFWIRPDTLLPLAAYFARNPHLLNAANQKDVQLVHAIERFFGLLPVLSHGQVGLLHRARSAARSGMGAVENGGYRLQHSSPLAHIGQARMGALLRQNACLAEDIETLEQSGLFDCAHYLDQCPQLIGEEVDLLAHYLMIGRFQGKTPHPDFLPNFYCRAYADQLENGLDPFLHYLREGASADLRLRFSRDQEQEEIPNFRYRALNAALINWRTEATKVRDPKLVSIIIPVLDQPELTRSCIEALYQYTSQEQFELIVVDNGSGLPTRKLLQNLAADHGNLRLIRNEENLNFALGCNLGFAASRGEKVIFLNNDTQVTPGWFEPLIEPLNRGDITAVQPRLLFPDGTIQCMGVVFSDRSPLGYPIYAGMKPVEAWAGRSRAFQAVTGACMAVRASDYAQVKGFDPVYVNGQEDVDLCFRLNSLRKTKCWYAGNSTVFHRESATPNRLSYARRNRSVFVSKWKQNWVPDDCENYRSDGFVVTGWTSDINNEAFNSIALFSPRLSRNTENICLGGAVNCKDDFRKILGNESPVSPSDVSECLRKNLKDSLKNSGYRVSVIMPTWNRKAVIDHALVSAFNQSVSPFEVIVIDDGSSDGTVAHLKSRFPYEVRTGRLKILDGEHKGVSAARNIGLKNASGNIIAYLDSDNMWHKDHLLFALSAFSTSDALVSVYTCVNVNRLDIGKVSVVGKSFDRTSLLKSNYVDMNAFLHVSEVVKTKGVFDENLKRLVDWELIIRYTEDYNSVLFIPIVTVEYFISRSLGNVTLTESLESNADHIYCKHADEYVARGILTLTQINDKRARLGSAERKNAELVKKPLLYVVTSFSEVFDIDLDGIDVGVRFVWMRGDGFFCKSSGGEEQEFVFENCAGAYWFPDRLQPIPKIDQLRALVMGVDGGYDVVVLSYGLENSGVVSVVCLRNQVMVNNKCVHAWLKGLQFGDEYAGKLIRIPPASSKNVHSVELRNITGSPVAYDSKTQVFTPKLSNAGAVNASFSHGMTVNGCPKSQKKRVLVIPMKVAVGGVERNTIEVIRRLKAEYEFIWITLEKVYQEQGSLAEQVMDVCFRFIDLAEIASHKDYLHWLSKVREWYSPDLVWVCNGSMWFCANAEHIRNVFSGIPIVDQQVYDVEQGWIKRYREAGIQSFDRFIAINRKIYDRFVGEFGMPKARVDLIYSLVDSDKFLSSKARDEDKNVLRNAFGLPCGKRVFAFMGRLVDQKRPLHFLKLAQCRATHVDEHYVLVGNGVLAHKVQEWLDANSPDNLTWIKYVEDTPSFWKVVDGMLVTSSYEGLPIAMLEALAMGVPVFATDVGDIRAVLEEHGAGSVVENNEDLSSAFATWVDRLPIFSKHLEKESYAVLERFSSDRIAQHYVDCWNAAIETSSLSNDKGV